MNTRNKHLHLCTLCDFLEVKNAMKVGPYNLAEKYIHAGVRSRIQAINQRIEGSILRSINDTT